MLCPTQVSEFENNLILYFFSAMPQVLGTMLALLGAFYPSRSSSLKTDIISQYNSSRNALLDFDISGGFNLRWNNEKRRLNDLVSPQEKTIVKQIYSDSPQTFSLPSHFNPYVPTKNYDYNIDEIHTNILRFSRQFSNNESTFEELKEYVLRRYTNTSGFIFANYDVLKNSKYLDSETFNDIYASVQTIFPKIVRYRTMKSIIKKIFVFNGVILGLFITSFIFLKFTSCSYLLHNLFLFIGALLAVASAYSMIFYVYNAVSENEQTTLFGFDFRGKYKNLVLWIKEKRN